MKPQERRQYSRKTLNPLPYINLPSGNGGIVLDVSEQGLRFRASAPMEQSGPILFWFTARSTLVSGVGELVWIDQAKKTGGLRFTQLPYHALEQIRKWPHDANLRMGIGQDLTLDSPPPGESPSSRSSERATYPALKSKVASLSERLLPESFKSKVKKRWLAAQGSSFTGLNELIWQSSFQKHKQWLFRATYALLLAIVFSTLVYVRHRQAGELLVRLGTKLSGQVTTAAPSPLVASQNPIGEDGSASKSTLDGQVEQAVPQSLNADAGKISEDISAGASAPQVRETPSRPQKPAVQGAQLVVQVAALKEEVEARELTDTLRHQNFQAFVGTLPVDSFYRVMLGPYADEASARVVLGKLKKAGFNSFIRRESFAELSDLDERRPPDSGHQPDQQLSSNSLPRIN